MGANKLRDKDRVALGIGITVMHLREILMNYYKGCSLFVAADTFPSNINVRNTDPDRHRMELRHYQRDRITLRDMRSLSIHGVDILEIQKAPDTCVLYGKTLQRSDAMAAIGENIQRFMAKYLRGVEVSVDNTKGASLSGIIKKDRKKFDDQLVVENVPREARKKKELTEMWGVNEGYTIPDIHQAGQTMRLTNNEALTSDVNALYEQIRRGYNPF